MTPRSASNMRAYKAALWTGLIYMWLLLLGGFALNNIKPEGWMLYVVLTAVVFVPLFLATAFCFKFATDHRFSYFITGIPAVLAALLQYFLMSFIPFLVVPRGVMVHIVGPAHPFDIFGQIVAVLPLIAWAILFPALGHLIADILLALSRRTSLKDRNEIRTNQSR
jgi:hypothetical protein